jgi:beta-mannosidase
LPQPGISVAEEPTGNGQMLTLTTDKPAFFVSVELGGRRVWSDNGFTLLPGRPKTLCVVRTLTNSAVPDVDPLTLQYL